jgi:endogenous inhibitor of DNA gyrase (YacG/DUF329 family)
MPKSLTQEEYINKALKVHNSKYDYTKTIYTAAHAYVTITCPIHGDFEQKAYSHTNSKQGCPTCAGSVVTQEDFITACSKIHNNFYDYSKTIYKKAHDKVTITCPTHGDFDQKAYVHKQGHKCPKCGKETVKEKARVRPNVWSYSGWKEAGNLSEYFQGFSLYIVECWNNSEHFIKIGKTFTSTERRFIKGSLPYSWKLLHQEVGSADYISTIECLLHNKFSQDKYIPQIKFNGYNECYSLSIKDFYGAYLTTTTNSKPHQE